MGIPFTISNVAETAISEINADSTTQFGGAGNRMVFGGVVISPKGAPFEVLRVNKSNVRALLGKPYHSSKGQYADNLRCLDEALNGGEGVVVRVVPSTATFPFLRIKTAEMLLEEKAGKAKEKAGEEKSTRDVGNVTEAGAQAYGSVPTISGGELMIVYVIDGDPSNNRKLEIKKADESAYGVGMYHMLLTQEDVAGSPVVLEEHLFSLDPEAIDDMGSPAYIETVLEAKSNRIRVVMGSDPSGLTHIAPTAFSGATNGEISAITASDIKKAVAVLSNAIERYNAVVGLGMYDADVIKALIAICNARRIGGYFDIDPRKTYSEAITAMTDLGISEHRAMFTHLPYTSIDPTYKNRVVFGLSGTHFTAKAKGVAKTSPTGGWHYTPAGEERAIISRTALRLADGAGEPDYEAMYTKRINKIGISQSGQLFIDDSLTSCVKENYLRYEQQVSVPDAMARELVALTNQVKHSPDGITYETLLNGMTDIAENYVSIGALVKPRNKEDGDEPYRIYVEQVEIDLWRVRWEICVTGSGRRFIGEPVLIR